MLVVVVDTPKQLVLFECLVVDLVEEAQAAMAALEATEHPERYELFGEQAVLFQALM
jgi:hypothetical protein